MSADVRLVTPSNENRSVPVRPPNSELRTREYLTPKEVEKLIKAAKDGRWGHRDATLVLVAFRHGLRASELCGTATTDDPVNEGFVETTVRDGKRVLH